MRALIVFCLLLGCQDTLFAQREDSVFIAKIADEILVSGKIYDNLRVLCKTVGGRLSGSPQMYKAEAWGVKTLKQAGADKVYLQECMVPHWTRGGRDEAWYNYKNAAGKIVREKLDVLALGNSVGTTKAGVKATVVYCNNFDDLERQKAVVKGRIVFFNYPFDERFVQTFRAYASSGVYRWDGPSRAARYGALAVVVRSLSASTDNNPHTGSTLYDTNYAKIPCAAMGLRDADKLGAVLKSGKQVELFYKSNAHFLPDTIGHNVIGEITGSELPRAFITVGGHLDSWDPAEGAQDDGAGCVHSIEVLRVFKVLGYRPRHTLRVVLFANEENGGRGGEAYAAALKKNGDSCRLALESDAGGFTPRAFSLSVNQQQLKKVEGWIPLLMPYGVCQFIVGVGGSDLEPLQANPAIVVGELLPDGNRYFDVHHARNDVFENVNKRELELGAVNMAALIYLADKYDL
ncbi:MAG: M20/M25/M40 family metallo-hydrolase [Bacteroidota bacterium]